MNSKNLKLKALNIATAMLCIGLLFFVSCRDEDGTGHDPSQPIAVTSFVPDSGRISEMVLLDGANFGTDTSNIKVYFNSKKAIVISSTGSRILALVPRLPGDTCIVTVEVDGKKATYPDRFRYKIEASASTLVGNGLGGSVFNTLDDSQFRAVYLANHNYDIFVTTETNYLLLINETENTVTPVAAPVHGMTARLIPNVHPETGALLMGNEGPINWNQFLILEPEKGWAPQNYLVREWIMHDTTYVLPTAAECTGTERTRQCMYCAGDGHLYTYYYGGQLVRINPETWVAEIIYKAPIGTGWGMTFNTIRPFELWIAFQSGIYQYSLCRVDVRDPAGTWENMSPPGATGFRDGKLNQAMFSNMRQIKFDSDGNLYICDSGNHCIRKVNTRTMMVETVLGIPQVAGYQNGKKEDALFRSLHGITITPDDMIYIGDWGNYRLRKVAVE